MSPRSAISRRQFISASVGGVAALWLADKFTSEAFANAPAGHPCLEFTHFPDRLHACIWRNWNLVPLENLATALNAIAPDLKRVAKAMGLPPASPVSPLHLERNYLCIIRRNWQLLPKSQIIKLLNWTFEKLEFTLREDDFFFIKLGSNKPECSELHWVETSQESAGKADWIRQILQEEFPGEFPTPSEQPFHFIKDLTAPVADKAPVKSKFSPRFGYSYFAPFGDPLLDSKLDPYPDTYLTRMAQSGMDGAWLHIVLSQLTPFPWDESISKGWETRLDNLSALVDKAAARGISIYLYLNEPRHLPLSFFDKHPELKGVVDGDHAALCTSHPKIENYLRESLAKIVERVPKLGGFFSITASENPTNCWSHGKGSTCTRCGQKGTAEVIARLNEVYAEGIRLGLDLAGTKPGPRLIVWDWGWPANVADEIIRKLPKAAWFMTVSEWDMKISRGGVESNVGEYSLSVVGPGDRAQHRWNIARQAGLKVIAKIQAGTTWEIGSVPYVPAVENAAIHAWNLRKAGVDGLMLNWTVGGYPSPNLEVVAAVGGEANPTVEEAMEQVANRRYGKAAREVVKAWKAYSAAFKEFPYNIGVLYNSPVHAGASNLLWQKPTGYKASMVGLPYDDLTAWRANYPTGVFIKQLKQVSDGFESARNDLDNASKSLDLTPEQRVALDKESGLAAAVAFHYASTANQAEFVDLRGDIATNRSRLVEILNDEIRLAKSMIDLQSRDSRLGFEASNQYFFLVQDLVEKVINCRHLRTQIEKST